MVDDEWLLIGRAYSRLRSGRPGGGRDEDHKRQYLGNPDFYRRRRLLPAVVFSPQLRGSK
jgi:hypothetical protein